MTNADQFKALRAYSPYHHVKDGTAYPAILIPDGRQRPPCQPDAVAQDDGATAGGERGSIAQYCCGRWPSAGHGIGTALDEQIEQGADVFAFLFDQLGVTYAPAPL